MVQQKQPQTTLIFNQWGTYSKPTFKLPARTLTTFEGFIRAVGTIKVVVAHKVLGDALSVLAHEFIFSIARIVVVHWKQTETLV